MLAGTRTTGDDGAVARADLQAFHQRWIRPDNARIYVVSDKSIAELRPLLDARFGTWSAAKVEKGTKSFSSNLPAPKPRIVLIDRPLSPQSLILGVTAR